MRNDIIHFLKKEIKTRAEKFDVLKWILRSFYNFQIIVVCLENGSPKGTDPCKYYKLQKRRLYIIK